MWLRLGSGVYAFVDQIKKFVTCFEFIPERRASSQYVAEVILASVPVSGN